MFDSVFSRTLLPAWDFWRGDRARKYRREIRGLFERSASEVQEYQLGRIREICRHAYQTTPYYRKCFERLGITSFQKLTLEQFRRIPRLTRPIIRNELTSLLSSEYPRQKQRESATGGTTSSPLAFFMDWPSYHRRWAATYEWDERIGYWRGEKIAYLWGATQDFDAAPSWRARLVNNLVSRTRYLSSSPLDHEIMWGYYESLRRWRPQFLQAYPNPLAIFAEFLLENQLRLDIPHISVTAEPLLESQIGLIAEAFGTRPYNWYGAREVGRIATECRFHHGMHINAYGLYVELETDDAFQDSCLGRIVITDLWNYAMPMLRYEIGDLGSITSEECPCGLKFPRVRSIEGRSADVFVNSRGQHIPGVAFTNRIVKNDEEIREMQVLQKGIGLFEVHVVPGPQWQDEKSRIALTRKISDFMNESIQANVVLVDSIPREKSGKLRFCKSLLDTNTSALANRSARIE